MPNFLSVFSWLLLALNIQYNFKITFLTTTEKNPIDNLIGIAVNIYITYTIYKI